MKSNDVYFELDDLLGPAVEKTETAATEENSESEVIIKRIGIINAKENDYKKTYAELEEIAEFIEKKRIYRSKAILELLTEGKIPLTTAKGIKRLVDMSADRKHSTDIETFQKQMDTIIKIPFCIYGEVYKDFEVMEKRLNESVYYAQNAIKKLIRAFRFQLEGLNTLQGNSIIVVGPPKSGKTTLINTALKDIAGQHVYHFDCNGISDSMSVDASSYIYTNANPAQIINILTETGVSNPYVVLDNVDKMSNSGRNGNPATVLAKWINRTINHNYIDGFINVPLDISSVNYILTAENMNKIPSELKNQAIIIEMGNYELDEKIEICRNFIVKKSLTENGLDEDSVVFERDAIIKIINEKAFEPGLAELIKIVEDIISKESENKGNLEKRTITAEYIDEYFKEGNAKAILRLTDSKFESFRRLAKTLPNYPRIEQDKILEKAKLVEYYLPISEEKYFDLLSKYPRGITETKDLDYKEIEEMAAQYHGAKEPKEQLLTIIAKNNLSGSHEGCVIGLIGNPGTGKTNFAQFAARLLGRQFVVINMNNIVDPSEIAGIADKKIGKLAQGFIDAGSEFPVILLDELEKASTEVQNTLLAYLDPLQNRNLKDEYLGINIPIQQAVIIATINNAENLSYPVYDRLDKIWMEDYSNTDKVEISKNGKIKKYTIDAGLNESSIDFSDEVLLYIAKHYGFGCGYRRMEMALQRIIGGCAREILSHGLDKAIYKKTITQKDVAEYLGEPLVRERKVSTINRVGVVNGLAAGILGGDILPIEAVAYKGKGEYELTGSLGEVMKESAKVARIAVRKLLAEEGNTIDLNKIGIHLHAPDGAQKKEGPSAGIAIALALYSAITKQPVRSDIALSGEINLQGDILRIGGLEQKLTAAFESGIHTVLLSGENREDIEKLDDRIIGKNRIKYVSTLREVINISVIREGKSMTNAV